jgi:MFS family permease
VLSTYRRVVASNPALARLLAGEFVSGIGDWLYLVAILVVVYAESDSALLLGVIGAARILPYVLLSVPAGVVVDRYERRVVLLITDVGRGVLMLVLAGLVLADGPIALVIAISIAAACLSTFFGPAIAALIPELVDESELASANAAWATLDNLAFIIGPALAGLLIATGGLSLAFLLNALSFAVVAVVLWRLPVRRPSTVVEAAERERPAEQAKAGWRHLARPLAGPLLLDAATSFVAGGLSVLTVVIAIDVIGAGEAGAGYLNAAIGAGGVVAGVVAGSLVARGLLLPLLLGGAVSALGVAWLGFTADLLNAMLALAVGVAGGLLLDVINTTLVQRNVPGPILGRALGVAQTSAALFYAAGSLVLPVLADRVGLSPVLVAGAVLIVLGTLAAAALGGATVRGEAPDADRALVVRLPIFAGLPAARLEAAARAMVPVSVSAATPVVREGDRADRFYVIADGSFSVSKRDETGEERELRRLARGDVFGEIGLLEGSPRTATVTAASDGRLLALDGATFLELVGSGPGLGSRLLDLYRGASAHS